MKKLTKKQKDNFNAVIDVTETVKDVLAALAIANNYGVPEMITTLVGLNAAILNVIAETSGRDVEEHYEGLKVGMEAMFKLHKKKQEQKAKKKELKKEKDEQNEESGSNRTSND